MLASMSGAGRNGRPIDAARSRCTTRNPSCSAHAIVPVSIARFRHGIIRTRPASVSAENARSTRATHPPATRSSAGNGFGSEISRSSFFPCCTSSRTIASGARPSMKHEAAQREESPIRNDRGELGGRGHHGLAFEPGTMRPVKKRSIMSAATRSPASFPSGRNHLYVHSTIPRNE